MMANKIMPVT